MADEILAESLGLPDDDEMRRRLGIPTPFRVAPPMAPPQGGGIPMPRLPQRQAMGDDEDNPAPTNVMPRQSQLPTNIAPAQMPQPNVNPHTAEIARLEKTGSGVSQIQNPFLRGLARIGDVGASILAPRAAEFIPGTTMHHQQLIGEQEGELNEDTKREQEAAQTAEANARAQELAHPKPQLQMTDQGLVRVPQEGPAEAVKLEGQNLNKPDVAPKTETPEAQAFDAYVKGGMTPTDAFRKVQQDKQEGIALGKPDADEKGFQEFYTNYLQDNKLQPSAHAMLAARKAWAQSAQKPTSVGINLMMPNPDGSGYTMQRVAPGQTVGEGAVTPTQLGTLSTPTQQMKNVAAQASLVHQKTPEMLSEIDAMKDQVGPLSGRWHEFMQGTIGAPSKEMAGLRADLLMYSSAVALMHARGRLPENLREEFDHAINAPKQDAENLKATITKIDSWVGANMKAMQAPQQEREQEQQKGGAKDLGAAPAGATEGKTGTLPDGTRVKVVGGRLVAQ